MPVRQNTSLGTIRDGHVTGAVLASGDIRRGRWWAELDGSTISATNCTDSLRLVRLLRSHWTPIGDSPVEVVARSDRGADTYTFSGDLRHRHRFVRELTEDGVRALALLANPFNSEDRPVTSSTHRPTLDAVLDLINATGLRVARLEIRNLITVRTAGLAEALSLPRGDQRVRPITQDLTSLDEQDLVIAAWGGAGDGRPDIARTVLRHLHEAEADVRLRALQGRYYVSYRPPQPSHPTPRAVELRGSTLHAAPADWVAGRAELPEGIRGGRSATTVRVRQVPSEVPDQPATPDKPAVTWHGGRRVNLEALLGRCDATETPVDQMLRGLTPGQRTALRRLLYRDVPARTQGGPARLEVVADELLDAASHHKKRLLTLLAQIAVDAGGTGTWPPDPFDLLRPGMHPDKPPRDVWGWIDTADGLRRPGPGRRWRSSVTAAGSRIGEPHVSPLDRPFQAWTEQDDAHIHPDAAGTHARTLVLYGPGDTDPDGFWPPTTIIESLKASGHHPCDVQCLDTRPAGTPDDADRRNRAVAELIGQLPHLRTVIAVGPQASATAEDATTDVAGLRVLLVDDETGL